MKNKIVAVHLLNDYSGSPMVLRQALESLMPEYAVELYTATPGGNGALSGISGVQYHSVFYGWHQNKAVTLAYFLWSQLYLFCLLMKNLSQSDTVYINTLLPFSAALAARLRGCKTVYHIHEVSIRPKALKNFLSWVAGNLAHQTIFVSAYVAAAYPFKKPLKKVVYNSVSDYFEAKSKSYPQLNITTPFTVLMLCSLKAYKGVYEFINLAGQLPHIRFVMVLNASEQAVACFKNKTSLPNNCTLYAEQKDTLPFYKTAHLVVNFSKPEGWVETFGMTVLEAMHFGRPVIVPQVGGVCELVQTGVEGFQINSADTASLVQAINRLSTDYKLYLTMSDAARCKAHFFAAEKFQHRIRTAFGISINTKSQSNSQLYFEKSAALVAPQLQ